MNTLRRGGRDTIRLNASSRASTRAKTNRPAAAAPPDYRPIKVIGQGAFGIVYSARAADGSIVAVKKVLQDPRYKNRELETMQLLKSPNCVALKGSFKTSGRRANEVYLNLVMDYLPMTLHQFDISYRKERNYPPLLFVKLFAFELFAGLDYLHSIGVTHRDIKPTNVLIDPETGELKICDFGSAKRLKPEERSVSYIASRYYRAPELIFDCVHYTNAIDIWAAGCVIAEMMNAGMPVFIGESSIGQLYEIVKVIGAPTDDDLRSFQHTQNVQITMEQSNSLQSVMPKHTPSELMNLLETIFVYNPTKRPTAKECMNHEFFNELFEYEIVMPSGRPGPALSRD